MSKVYGNSIRKDNGYDAGSYTYIPVAIIGAGESGIAMGCRLKEVLGHDQFRIFDRQSGIGGTWWINRCKLSSVSCTLFQGIQKGCLLFLFAEVYWTNADYVPDPGVACDV